MLNIALGLLLILSFAILVLRAGQVVTLASGTAANIGYGSSLGYSADGNAYTNALQVLDISGPDISVKPVQVTNNDSPAVGGVAFHEKIPGLCDAGTVTFNCVHKRGGLLNLYALIGLLRYWRVTYVDTTTWTCQGFITKISSGDPLEDKQTIDVTLEWTGRPTLA